MQAYTIDQRGIVRLEPGWSRSRLKGGCVVYRKRNDASAWAHGDQECTKPGCTAGQPTPRVQTVPPLGEGWVQAQKELFVSEYRTRYMGVTV